MPALALHDTGGGHLLFMVLAFLTLCVALALVVMLFLTNRQRRP